MMRVVSWGMLCLLAAAIAATPAGAAAPAKDKLPPLIDRELFFGDPEISAPQLSPDGRYISFIKPYRDARNIWVKGLDQPFADARPVTADERPVPGYFWSRDSRYLLYVQDKGGNEDFHVYAVDPAADPEPDTGVPPARDLTPLDGVRAVIYAVPERTPDELIVGLNDRDPSYHDVYRVGIASGERTLLIRNVDKVGGYSFDLDGRVRLATRQLPGGGTEILRVEEGGLVQIFTCTFEEQAYPIRFHKDGRRAYLVTNQGEDVDLSRLMLLDPQTGDVELVESDPEGQVDFGGPIFDAATDELIGTAYLGDRLRIYPREEQLRRDLELLRKQLPDGELNVASSTKDMRLHLVSVASDVDPGSVYLYDRATGRTSLLYRTRPDLPSEHLAPMQAIRYRARDGLEIPAYLTLPRGVQAKKLPLIVHPHGGPWARDTWGYDPYAQFLANRGYAVLQPNFRSSSGYGKKFLNAGNHEWGIGAMQHDLTDGVQHLVKQGIADAKRVGIFGGSYGGYATLAGVTYTPDLYACGVPYVAPSSLVTLIESFPAYWRPFLEGSWYRRVGDPAKEEDRADLIARSPLFQIDRIKAPLLVVHGANDPRVKQHESDQIVVALREKGRPVEYIVAPDEGHGFRSAENRLALAVAMERFLARHLGGRYQEEMTAPVAARLAQITVDVATVEMPDAAAQAEASAAARSPLPAADGARLRPATLRYAGALNLGGQKIEMTTTRTIAADAESGRELWRFVDAAKLPMGAPVDTFWVDRRTLEPVRRGAGGMGEMRLRYEPDAVTGAMGGGGQSLPVQMKLDAPVFGDGPGFEAVVAGLPLADGYAATLRIFEAAMQKVRPLKLTVTGRETAAVPAGSFEAFVVEVQPLDGEPGGGATLRVLAQPPHHVVRSEYALPPMMGGGTMTAELTAIE